MMAEPVQSYPSICFFYCISATFHLFSVLDEEIIGVHNDKSIFIHQVNTNKIFLFNVNVQVL